MCKICSPVSEGHVALLLGSVSIGDSTTDLSEEVRTHSTGARHAKSQNLHWHRARGDSRYSVDEHLIVGSHLDCLLSPNSNFENWEALVPDFIQKPNKWGGSMTPKIGSV